MALTNGQIVGLMQHALGKTPDSRHDLWEAYNAAGRYIYGYHPWRWRLSIPTTFTWTASASTMALPSDADEVTDIYIPQTGIPNVLVVSKDQMIELRRRALGFPGRYAICVQQMGQNGNSVLQIYPAPSANTDFEVVYLRRWTELTSGDSSANPAVPLEFQHALKLAARAIAVNIENQAVAFEDVALQSELERLRVKDNNYRVPLSHTPRVGPKPVEILRQWNLNSP